MLDSFLDQLLDSWRVWMAVAITLGVGVAFLGTLYDLLSRWVQRLMVAYRYPAQHRMEGSVDRVSAEQVLRQLEATRRDALAREWRDALESTRPLPVVTHA